MVANTFNSSFTTIASNHCRSLPLLLVFLVIHRRCTMKKRESSQTLFFQTSNRGVGTEKLKGLNPSKATGFDNIPNFSGMLLKKIIPVITHLINVSIGNNHFPNKLKVAREISLYKKGSNLILEFSAPYLSCVQFHKLLKGSFMSK